VIVALASGFRLEAGRHGRVEWAAMPNDVYLFCFVVVYLDTIYSIASIDHT